MKFLLVFGLALVAILFVLSTGPAKAQADTCTPNLEMGTCDSATDAGLNPASTNPVCIAAPTGTYSCWVCGWMTKLENLTSQMARASFRALVPAAAMIATATSIIALCFIVFKVIWAGSGVEETVAQGSIFLVTMIICGLLLWAGNSNGFGLNISEQGIGSAGPIAIAYIFDPMQIAGLGSAQTVLGSISNIQGQPFHLLTVTAAATSANGSSGTAISLGGYAQLWGQVEATVFRVFQVAVGQIQQSRGWVDSLSATALWLLALTPYLFVMIIFGFYLLQTMFYFSAIAGVAPILIALMPIKQFRSFFFAGLRFCFGGALTIVFASFAMALTGAVVNGVLNDVLAAIGTETQDPSCAGISFTQSTSSVTALLGGPFFTLIIFGGLSAILHLAAPRIASNIAGSNDSATSAAAVVWGAALGLRTVVGQPKNTGSMGGMAGLGGAAWGGLMGVMSKIVK